MCGGGRINGVCVGVGVVEAITACEAKGHQDVVGDIGELELSRDFWVVVANLCPLTEVGAGCKDCLRGNNCLHRIWAVVACSVEYFAIVECQG